SNSLIHLQVVQGETYYLSASVSPQPYAGGEVGSYTLTLTPEVGDDFASAEPLALAADSPSRQESTIDLHGDLDFFSFVAPATGKVLVRLDATGTFPDNLLDPHLTIYDGAGTALAANDNAEQFITNSLVAVNVTEGQTYYARAAASPAVTFGQTGRYALTLALDVGDDFSLAQTLPLSLDGSAAQGGAIDVAGDVDFFR